MTLNYYGAIDFKRKLTKKELKQLILDVELNPDSYVLSEYVELNDCWDVLSDISEWLKAHGNDVKEGSCVKYYGDYDGCERYENGEWVGYDADPLCLLDDKTLFDELIYRGYDVSGVNKIRL